MSGFTTKFQSRLFDSRYKLVYKMGQGGWGTVWLGQDIMTGEEVALKLERGDVRDTLSNLSREYDTYQSLRDQPGFARARWCGNMDDFQCVVLDVLGPNLEDLLQFCGGRFSLKTTLMIADQLLYRLETLHVQLDKAHRDVKPTNCMLGRGRAGNTVHVADFGHLLPVQPRVGTPVEVVEDGQEGGSLLFSSIRGHVTYKVSPEDDLESLGYMLIYFLRGKVPWQKHKGRSYQEQRQLVLADKKALTPDKLCKGLPAAFETYLSSVRFRVDETKPDYEMLRQMFRTLAQTENIEYDDVYDWTVRMYYLALGEAKQSPIDDQDA